MYSDYEYETRSIEIDDRPKQKLSYPCLVLDGIDLKPELEFYMKKASSSNYSIPFYCRRDGVYGYMGNIDLSLDTFMTIYSISKEYTVELQKSIENKVIIDYTNPDVLEKFIKL